MKLAYSVMLIQCLLIDTAKILFLKSGTNLFWFNLVPIFKNIVPKYMEYVPFSSELVPI